jgi:aminopeptidase YwaD
VQHPEALSIPVLFLNSKEAKKYFSDDLATLHIEYKVGFSDSIRTATNVLGFIDNKAPSTIIVGAHFDHLGYGEDGNSLFRTGEKLIHNGADDNASGVAAMLEMARLLKASNLKKNNYLFAAFTGEELGLFGSKYFTGHPTVDLSSVNCMINLDMVGRLNADTKVLNIGGYGTSPEWSKIFHKLRSVKDFVPKFDSSGVGPSDHTSFYQKNIPVLFFFTGTHSDYHKPTDDADKINFTGETKLVSYLFKITSLLNASPRAGFLKTKETQMGSATRFAVTLGIMPDYSFDGAGVRVDGVTEGRPAQLAGVQTGDVILELGDNKISSLENYMQALGKFKKGDSAKLRFKRKDALVDTTIKFE